MAGETTEQKVERLERQVTMLFNQTAWLEQKISELTDKEITNKEEEDN